MWCVPPQPKYPWWVDGVGTNIIQHMSPKSGYLWVGGYGDIPSFGRYWEVWVVRWVVSGYVVVGCLSHGCTYVSGKHKLHRCEDFPEIFRVTLPISPLPASNAFLERVLVHARLLASIIEFSHLITISIRPFSWLLIFDLMKGE